MLPKWKTGKSSPWMYCALLIIPSLECDTQWLWSANSSLFYVSKHAKREIAILTQHALILNIHETSWHFSCMPFYSTFQNTVRTHGFTHIHAHIVQTRTQTRTTIANTFHATHNIMRGFAFVKWCFWNIGWISFVRRVFFLSTQHVVVYGINKSLLKRQPFSVLKLHSMLCRSHGNWAYQWEYTKLDNCQKAIRPTLAYIDVEGRKKAKIIDQLPHNWIYNFLYV